MRPSRRLLVLPAAAVLSAAATLGAVSPASAAPAVGAPSGTVAHVAAARPPFPGKSARQIRDASVKAFRGAKTFRITGTEVDKKFGKMTLDFHVSAAQSFGTITSPKGDLEIRRIGNVAWFTYDDKYAETMKLSPDSVGSWFKINRNTKGWSDIVEPTSQAAWAKTIAAWPMSSRAKGATFTGTPTIRLVQPGRLGGSMYVATSGPAFPRHAFRNDRQFTYSFYEYNQSFSVDEPTDQVIDTTNG